MASLKLSICTVLYESADLAIKFYHELRASLAPHTDFEIIYYDNSPSETLASWFNNQTDDKVHYVHDPRNLGFAYGNNQAILRARYSKILLLNPDVFGFSSDLWQDLAQRRTESRAWFARLNNPDGSFQDCVGETTSIGRAIRKRRDYNTINSEESVGMGIMAFMLTDKAVFALVGLLDTDYPLYAEDMDWCYRARKKGIDLVYDPKIQLTHVGGSSAKTRWAASESVRKKYLAEKLFINKHFRGLKWLLMRAMNSLKTAVRTRFYVPKP